MKLSQIRLENFRGFKDQTVNLDDYTSFVGVNGAGKSTVLAALNIFFRNTSSSSTNVVNLSLEDFHRKSTKEPVRITLTFSELSSAAQEDLKHYYRQGKLIVRAEAHWDAERGQAEVKQKGSRLVMAKFRPFFEADGAKKSADELKSVYERIRKEVSDLAKWSSKTAAITALQEYEEAHPEKCDIADSPAEFYGWTKGENRLGKHVQWVYVPAVKDASGEQVEGGKTALGLLLDRTIRAKVNFTDAITALKRKLEMEYQEILEGQQSILAELKTSLEKRLQTWASPAAVVDLKWHYDPEKSISVQEPLARISLGEDGFLGEVARLGHGIQRSFIVSLLHELAEIATEGQPGLLLGIEEPELYQHPPQARHIASLLEQMANDQRKNTQVVVCTHSPYFVSATSFERVRHVRKRPNEGVAEVHQATYASVEKILAAALNEAPRAVSVLLSKVNQIMQPSQRELFFCKVAVIVEGLEDIAYLATQVELAGRLDEWRRLGCHFIMAGGKTNMSRLHAIARELQIPAFAMWDGDTDIQDAGERERRDNACLLNLAGEVKANPLTDKTIWGKSMVMWKTRIGTEIEQELGARVWDEATAQARAATGMAGVKQKNALLVAATLEVLKERGKTSKLLEQAVDAILGLAKGTAG